MPQSDMWRVRFKRQIDREGDRFWTLAALQRMNHWFTVRSPARLHRQERTARLRIRTASVSLDMVEAHGGAELDLAINVVDVMEVGTTPRR